MKEIKRLRRIEEGGWRDEKEGKKDSPIGVVHIALQMASPSRFPFATQ
jgi:hypothetical protein